MRRPWAVKLPFASVAVVLRVPDGTCTITTSAPDTGPPSAVTEPRIVEVVSCAIAVAGATSAIAATPRKRLLRIEIFPLEVRTATRGLLPSRSRHWGSFISVA